MRTIKRRTIFNAGVSGVNFLSPSISLQVVSSAADAFHLLLFPETSSEDPSFLVVLLFAGELPLVLRQLPTATTGI